MHRLIHTLCITLWIRRNKFVTVRQAQNWKIRAWRARLAVGTDAPNRGDADMARKTNKAQVLELAAQLGVRPTPTGPPLSHSPIPTSEKRRN